MPNFKSLATVMPHGFSNSKLTSTMNQSGIPDPTYSHLDLDDFNVYTAAQYTVTASSSGSVAAAAGDGGLALISTAATNSDSVYVQRPNAGFTLTPGKQTFMKFFGQLSNASLGAFFFGLLNTGTTPLAPTDGVYISKAAGSNTFTLNSMVGSALTSVALPAGCVAVNGTNFELGIFIDNQGNVGAYFDPTTGTQSILNAVASTNQAKGICAALYAPGLTTATLNPSFGIKNGAADATVRTLTVDFWVVSNER